MAYICSRNPRADNYNYVVEAEIQKNIIMWERIKAELFWIRSQTFGAFREKTTPGAGKIFHWFSRLPASFEFRSKQKYHYKGKYGASRRKNILQKSKKRKKVEKKFKKGVDKERRTRYNNRAVRESGKRGHWKLNNEDKYKAQSARKVGQRIWEKGFVWEREDEWLSQGWLGAGDTESSETSK